MDHISCLGPATPIPYVFKERRILHLKLLDRFVSLGATIACLAALFRPPMALLAKSNSPKWPTLLHARCLAEGYMLGALVGVVIGAVVFCTVLRRRNTWPYSVAALLVASPIAGIVGGIVVLVTIGSVWPSEQVYGYDPDNLIEYGSIAATTFAAACIGTLATVRRPAE